MRQRRILSRMADEDVLRHSSSRALRMRVP
jgi:hypothetical protein